MKTSNLETKLTKNYFDEWAADYDTAFEGGTEDYLIQKIINKLFRSKTFALRDKHLTEILKNLRVQNRKILDIGCGSGQLALRLAKFKTQVIGWDISPEMIRICQKKAKQLKLNNVKFQTKDLVSDQIPKVDIIFCIAVIEYYRDFKPLMEKMFNSGKEYVIVTDARFIWWRVILRKILGKIKNFPVYYHRPKEVKAFAKKHDFKCLKETTFHTFRTFVFKRR